MFRRDVDPDGDPVRYSVVGLWGSGNVVGDRAGLEDDTYTAYSMWDGHALFGPGRPSAIEKAPVLIAVLGAKQFVARYGALGERCEVWQGDEVTGIGCDAACTELEAACPERDPAGCRADCARLPRALTDCVRAARTCDEEVACHESWAEIQAQQAAWK
ncbi:MAG: hypothetical protein R3F59_04870 [Myxococcota bacterium]